MSVRQSAGFTLVELLIAITIFAVISALAYGGLQSVIRSDQAITAQTKRLQALQQTLLFMQRDMAQLVPRSIRDEFGDRKPALLSQGNMLTQIELTRGGWNNPAMQMRATLQRVGYGLEGRELYRYSWRVLDRAPDSQPERVLLLDGVSEWQWRFLDDNGGWQESWPSLGSEGGAVDTLPRAVEVKLTLEDMGTVRRIFEMGARHIKVVQGP